MIFGPCPDLPNEAAHIQTNYGSLSPTYRRSQHANMNFQLQSAWSSALGKCRSLSVKTWTKNQGTLGDVDLQKAFLAVFLYSEFACPLWISFQIDVERSLFVNQLEWWTVVDYDSSKSFPNNIVGGFQLKLMILRGNYFSHGINISKVLPPSYN